MEYKGICKNNKELNDKLNRFIKIELLNDTDSYFVGGKITRYQNICQYINLSYKFDFKCDNNLDITLDTLTALLYIYLVEENYITNTNINRNILYIPLIPKDKYKFFEETIKALEIQNDITDISLSFELNYNQNNISDFEKKRLGEYKISITNNILMPIPIKINTLCEIQSGKPMEEYQEIYNERYFGYP